MNSKLIFFKLTIFAFLFATITSYGQCPSNAQTTIEVCNDAGGNGTIRAIFNDGTPPFSYILFDLSGPTAVSTPFGPVTITNLAPNIVEFGGVPNGSYVIRVNGPSSCFSIIGGLGINVNSANAIAITQGAIDPD